MIKPKDFNIKNFKQVPYDSPWVTKCLEIYSPKMEFSFAKLIVKSGHEHYRPGAGGVVYYGGYRIIRGQKDCKIYEYVQIVNAPEFILGKTEIEIYQLLMDWSLKTLMKEFRRVDK